MILSPAEALFRFVCVESRLRLLLGNWDDRLLLLCWGVESRLRLLLGNWDDWLLLLCWGFLPHRLLNLSCGLFHCAGNSRLLLFFLLELD